uniref:GH92 family glycosyl hydrolase n=1 Tax=Pricia sp. TaxID=2268138 RepID=UPI00359372EF
MKIRTIVLLLVLVAKTVSMNGQSIKKVPMPVDLVDVFIDTRVPRFDYFISASLPFGMITPSPDTKHGELWNAGYRYDDKHILNFSHIHNTQTAGIPVMPVTGVCRGNEGFEANKSRFEHEKEVARPGYHKVFLDDYGITAELTATTRTALHRYTFPKTEEAHILFDIGAAVGPTDMSYAYAKRVNDSEIEGYSVMTPTMRRKKPFLVHFVAKFNKRFDSFAGWSKVNGSDTPKMVKPNANIVEGEDSGVYVSFDDLEENQKLLMKIGISYVSAQNARLNMNTELDHWDFEKVVDDATETWNDYLGRIQVEGGTEEQRVKLYTDLMHTASKRIANDVDGSYADWTGPQPVIRQLPLDDAGRPKTQFLDGDGLWGSQWNLNILWSLLYPEYGNWMANTFLEYYKNAGMMSRSSWGGNYSYVMVGDHSTPLLAALMSTKRNTFDPFLAYEASYKNAFPGGIRDRAGYEAGPNPKGGGIDLYDSIGYVPVEIAERGEGYHRGGTSMTLEYAYQDWCLATMAKLLEKKADATLFEKRSENWRNVFNSDIGWARPRHGSGEWMQNFSPVAFGFNTPGFIEGSSATYSFYVPQNLNGLIEEMGGSEEFNQKLDSNFIKASPNRFIMPHGEHGNGWVDYENQPSCAMAHLFSHAGMPWKTQYWVHRVKEEAFGGTDPYSGYNGDEDQGQLGALGVLMAIGLFDVQGCVGESPKIEITTPLFNQTKLKFPSLDNPERMVEFEI